MKKLTLTIIVLFAGAVFGQILKSQNSKFQGIDEYIQEQMQTNHVPGLSAAIIVGDSVVWYNSYTSFRFRLKTHGMVLTVSRPGC